MCLTNHMAMGSTLHRIMSLVINTCHGQKHSLETRHAPATGWHISCLKTAWLRKTEVRLKRLI